MDKTVLAIIGIVIVESIALIQGVNGTVLSLAVATMAGLGGYNLRKKKEKKNGGDTCQ